MFERYSKLKALEEMGWTEEDISELFMEVVNKSLNNKNYLASKKHTNQMIREVLIDLGFSFAREGTHYIEEALVYCLEEGTAHILLRKDLYVVIQEKNNIKYEALRASVRTAIKQAFEKPTPLAKEWFHEAIERRGYPRIKEFLVTTYSLMLK